MGSINSKNYISPDLPYFPAKVKVFYSFSKESSKGNLLARLSEQKVKVKIDSAGNFMLLLNYNDSLPRHIATIDPHYVTRAISEFAKKSVTVFATLEYDAEYYTAGNLETWRYFYYGGNYPHKLYLSIDRKGAKDKRQFPLEDKHGNMHASNELSQQGDAATLLNHPFIADVIFYKFNEQQKKESIEGAKGLPGLRDILAGKTWTPGIKVITDKSGKKSDTGVANYTIASIESALYYVGYMASDKDARFDKGKLYNYIANPYAYKCWQNFSYGDFLLEKNEAEFYKCHPSVYKDKLPDQIAPDLFSNEEIKERWQSYNVSDSRYEAPIIKISEEGLTTLLLEILSVKEGN